MSIVDLSRLMSKRRVIALAVLVCAANIVFASDHCEAAKRAILNDCDTIEAYCDNATNKLRTAVVALRNATVQTSYYYNGSSATPTVNYGSLYDTSLYDSSGNSLGVTVGYYVSEIDRALASVHSIYPNIKDIRTRVNSVQCSGSNTCNCAEYLEPIQHDLERLMTDVSDIYIACEDIEGWAHSIYTWLSEDMQDNFENIFQYHDFMTNVFQTTTKVSDLPNFNNISYYLKLSTTGAPQLGTSSGRQGIFSNRSTVQISTLSTVIKALAMNIHGQLASLNNYHYTNYFTQASIYNSSVSNNVALGTIHHDLVAGFDGVTNKASIVPFIAELNQPVLDGISSQYFAALTNAYLQTWSANDNPNTNWFRRVELLLAAMVFRDSGHAEELEELEDDKPDSTTVSTLQEQLNAEDMFSVDIGSSFFDSAPQMPMYGSDIPPVLKIYVPKFGGESQTRSGDETLYIEIKTEKISALCDGIRAVFRVLWWGLVALMIFFVGRWFLRGCSFAFRLIQGVHFS